MIVKKVDALDKPVSQYMVPVLTTDYMLHGLVHIPQTEFTQTPQVVNVNGRDLQCVAYSFNERIVFCLMFNPCLSHGHREWLGLPNFLPLSKFQMTSYWVAPVGNIAQKYTDFGQVDLLRTSRYDKDTLQPMQDSDAPIADETVVATIRINVPASRWPKQFSVLDLNWMSLLISKLKMQCKHDSFKDVQILSSQAPFKAFALTADSSGIPQVLRLMLNAESVSPGEYQVVLQATGDKKYLCVLNFNVKP